MSEMEFLRRATQCKEAQEAAVDDVSRAQWSALTARWLRLADEAADAERRRAKRHSPKMTGQAPPP